jgi:lipopolysaccharide/colanic/teichoic acid biosynthesis glycosyltransferase
VESKRTQPQVADIAPPSVIVWSDIYRDTVKRAFDVVLSLVALGLLWPVMLCIAALVKLDSSGPALFAQKRIGRNGRPFQIYKFRTMTHALDESAHIKFMQAFVRGDMGEGDGSYGGHTLSIGAPTYKPFAESQVTRLGRILRKTSLDELPQLINVLRGEMSLVGPRPNVPYEVQAYKEWHRERLSVLPGITGLAQVKGRSALEFDTIARYDIQYAQHVSLGLDLQILINTVSCVIRGKGAQ